MFINPFNKFYLNYYAIKKTEQHISSFFILWKALFCFNKIFYFLEINYSLVMRALTWWPSLQGRHDDDARCRSTGSTESFLHYCTRHQCPRQTRVHSTEISCLVTYVPYSLPWLDRINYDKTFTKCNHVLTIQRENSSKCGKRKINIRALQCVLPF